MILKVVKSINFPALLFLLGLGASFFANAQSSNITASLEVLDGAGNSYPQISSILINSGNSITLNPNSTTTVLLSFQITDNNGCSDIFSSGSLITTLYRSSVSPTGSVNFRNLYAVGSSSIINSCVGSSTTANATATFQFWYFADATDSSSSFNGDTWKAYIQAMDASASTTATTSATGVELNTLVAMQAATSTISYGTVSAGGNTGVVNEELEILNVGNSTHTIGISGTAMTSGENSIPTSSQHFASGTFTYGGGEQELSATPINLSGFSVKSAVRAMEWTSSTPYPNPIFSPCVFGYMNKLYVVSGVDIGWFQTTTSRYSAISPTGTPQEWINTTALPEGVRYQGCAQNEDRVYVAGGITLPGATESDTSTRNVYMAQIQGDGTLSSWTTTTPLPYSMNSFTLSVYKGKMYRVGGYDSDTDASTSSIEFANINTDGTLGSWTNTQATPYSGLTRHATVILGDRLYLIGGGNGGAGQNVYSALVNGDGSLGSFFLGGYLPWSIGWHRSVSYNGRIYSMGGWNGNSTSSFYYINPNSNGAVSQIASEWQGGYFTYNWNFLPNMPDILDTFGVAVVNGRLYVVGGNNDSANQDYVFYTNLDGRGTYWGIGNPPGTPAGLDFSSTITYTAAYSP